MTREELNAVRGYVSNIQAIKDAHNIKQLPINYETICAITANGWKLIEELKILEQQPIIDVNVPHKIAEFFQNWDGDETAKMEISVNDMREIADIFRKKARAERQLTEIKPIGYRECSDAMLKMWMDNVLTDGEYYRIMDKLNAKWSKND